ncbi:MAG: ArsR family transcriptional regulator [Pseudomonadota bacterium]
MSSAALRIVEQDRRRAMLAVLLVAPAFRFPVRAVRQGVEGLGYVVSLDLARTDIAWLVEQGLVEQADEVVTLTDRGNDVVMGRVAQPGVKRPEPGQL